MTNPLYLIISLGHEPVSIVQLQLVLKGPCLCGCWLAWPARPVDARRILAVRRDKDGMPALFACNWRSARWICCFRKISIGRLLRVLRVHARTAGAPRGACRAHAGARLAQQMHAFARHALCV
jgi:hypothetical protein